MQIEIKPEALTLVRSALKARRLLALSKQTGISYHILYNAAKDGGADVLDAEHCQMILEHLTGKKLELR